MWADVVVPEPKDAEVAVELRQAGHLPLIELLFEGAEEAFDATILPGAAGVGALVADAKQFESVLEQAGGEDGHFDRLRTGFVVGAYRLGFTVNLDGGEQVGKEDARGFVVWCL